jgi:hypothetical protein
MKKETSHNISVQAKLLLLCLGLLIISIAGYLASHDLWVRYVFGHTGGLSIMGLFGCWAGALAKKKGYGYWKVFLFGFALPSLIGIISTCLVYALGGHGCGGIVSITVAILVVIFYYIIKHKNISEEIKA